ncbi:MAG: DUF559 domain-containing protein [Actinobacteria bacterium]|nr:DUF559 domain-containing protein [Actinomycetota bacterium]
MLRTLDQIARRQYGLLTRAQLLHLGMSRGQIQRWLGEGRLIACHPGVYRLAGAPPGWEQRVLAAVLAAGPGALASHRAAARLWGMGRSDVVEISVPRARPRQLAGVVVHRSRDLEVEPGLSRGHIPVTRPMRVVVDLGSVVGPDVVEDALDLALANRLFTVAGVEWALDELARPGRRGAGVLRRVLDDRALGTEAADGLLEPRMARLLVRAGLPTAAFQHELVLAGQKVRVDFAYPDHRLAIEVDGWSSRASVRGLQGDDSRQNLLVLHGWTVLRFTWRDVVRRPETVANQINLALGRLSAA